MISTKPIQLNVHPSIRDNLNPDSNMTQESNMQSDKHITHKTSTDARTMISTKPARKNAHFLMRVTV
jgi:hypothetical protein